jgi:hypothetical protein
MTPLIHKLKRTKPATDGRWRWRFSLAVDILGHTVLSDGWMYLPWAKEGFRVSCPKKGHYPTFTGVLNTACAKALEKIVEKQLMDRQGEASAPDDLEAEFIQEEE